MGRGETSPRKFPKLSAEFAGGVGKIRLIASTQL